MEALLTQYASSSEEEEEEEEEERFKEKSRVTKKVGKAVVVDPAPNVNVANLALARRHHPGGGGGGGGRGGGGGDGDDDGRTRGGEGDALVVVPKSDVAAANGEAFLEPNAQVLMTNATYEQMNAKVEGPEHPDLKRRDRRRARNHHMGFVQTVNVDSFAFDAQYNTQMQMQQQEQREQQQERGKRGGGGGDRSVSGKSATTNNNNNNNNSNWSAKTVYDMTKKERREKRNEALMEVAASFGGIGDDGNEGDGIGDTNGAWAKSPGPKRDVMKKSELSREQKEYLEWHAKRNDAKRKARGKLGDAGRDDDDVVCAAGKNKNKEGGDEDADEVELKRRQQAAKTKFHGEEEFKYDGSSWLAKPKALKSRSDRCYMPEKVTKQWIAHGKGVSHLEFFPNSGHVLLTCGMEGVAKIWDSGDENNKFKLLRSYTGHAKAIKAGRFTPNDGSMFATCGWDHKVRLWDTETGAVVRTVSSGKTPLCLAFHPQKSNILLVGQSDKKIVQYDMQSGDVVQEYDQHLGGVNSIAFCDGGKRFASTSDDKTLRAWEFGIPVTMKYVADPLMHSMPSTKMHPGGDYLACQSLDNSIKIYSTKDRFREKRNKSFMGHQNAGFACEIAFSPDDGKYMASGDGDGRLFFWDFKTGRKMKTFKAHDKVCITLDWHPLLASRVSTGSWDGKVKVWD